MLENCTVITLRDLPVLMLFVSPGALAQDQDPAPVSVDGVLFSHFGVDLSDDDLASDFDVDRAYLTFRRDIGDDFAVRVTTDVGRVSEDDAKLSLFVKYAYAEWKGALPGTTLRFGAAAMPFPGYYDTFWGHRYVSKSFTDANKLLKTSDFGVHALGQAGDGLLDWQLSVVNGEGQASEEADADKSVITRVSIDPLTGRDAGQLPLTVTLSQDVLMDSPRTVYGGAVGFANEATTVWVEYIGTLESGITGTGYSATVVQGLGPVNLLARYDHVDQDTAPDDGGGTEISLSTPLEEATMHFIHVEKKSSTLIAGLSAELEKGVAVALTFEQSVEEADPDNPEQGVFLRTQAEF